MKSAGNDIVALRLVDKQRTSQFRFYSKILSASEQELYHQLQFAEMPFENYVWLLWSVKESAYKYLKRTDPGLVFSATRIITQYIKIPAHPLIAKSDFTKWDSSVNNEDLFGGKVNYQSHTFYFRSKITEEWIATVVNDDENFENVCWGVQSIDNTDYEYQSNAAKTLLLNKLNPFYHGDLQVEKSPVGYPVILQDTEDMDLAASLTHDGNFVAYSFWLNPANPHFCNS